MDQVITALHDPASLHVIHRYFAADCFNRCWEEIEKPERSDEDTDKMLTLAYASLWHWKQREDCRPVNLSIAYWQLSRVHSLAGDAHMARRFGDKCVAVGKANALDAFHVGYGYEALARAGLLEGDCKRAARDLAEADTCLGQITDAEERRALGDDLAALRERLA